MGMRCIDLGVFPHTNIFITKRYSSRRARGSHSIPAIRAASKPRRNQIPEMARSQRIRLPTLKTPTIRRRAPTSFAQLQNRDSEHEIRMSPEPRYRPIKIPNSFLTICARSLSPSAGRTPVTPWSGKIKSLI